ncbi:MAG TPA: ABC transporter substrate-binding protein [Chloroflexota bacterium]|nr:ABC transporter substrate-binding protein [Chloroflexota bacterium]
MAWKPSAAVIAGSLIALAACGGSAPSSAPASVAASAPALSSAPATTQPLASKPAAASPAAAASGGPVKVGLIEALTGPFAELGKDNQDGFNLYLASISGAVAGRKIEPVIVDSQAQPDTALTKAKQLVENDKVQVLMGMHGTPECYALAGYAKQAQVPMIVSGNCGAQTLTTDPKFASPYLARLTQTTTVLTDPAADWAYKQGYRKAIVIVLNYGGGLEALDAFASAFVQRGGSIVQELTPDLGTPDFGPVLAQLDPKADFLYVFTPGTDALRLGQQYGNYSGQQSRPFIDGTGQITSGPNGAQLKDKTTGFVGVSFYTEAIPGPQNEAFLKAFRAKYPDRPVSTDVVQGWTGAQFLAAALQKVNGAIENKQAFLEALDNAQVETPKGPVALDKTHDVIENMYTYRLEKGANGVAPKLLETYKQVSSTWDRTPQELERLPLGKLKGKWVGMTKDQLAKLTQG